MKSEPRWIDSLGGMYVCLPESVRELWRGGVEDDEDDPEESTDYWQAGQGDGAAGVFSLAGSQVLTLAAGEGALTYVPSLDLFVQRRASTSVTNVIEVVAEAFPVLRWGRLLSGMREAIWWFLMPCGRGRKSLQTACFLSLDRRGQ
ncbi:Imm21 family immunity protein [Streptomyces sp. NPDC060198]|uniref:Imm21 family immunity protein n=1 Tax=Streptomyces sp. NPDC060198 TaxID=3347070 RepID=UPI00366314E6